MLKYLVLLCIAAVFVLGFKANADSNEHIQTCAHAELVQSARVVQWEINCLRGV